MTWLSDNAVARLRAGAEQPDFSGTRYRVERELARGGMGVVYEAEDMELGRRVAIKVLASELASADAVERMRAEARTIAKLEHPGIVPLHDVGVLSDGRLWYAMKLVRGRRLDQLEATPLELLRVFLRICEAVAFAHANGAVHCDLKPENVMLGDFGEVLVMDWGVAREIGSAGGIVAGTRGYRLVFSFVSVDGDHAKDHPHVHDGFIHFVSNDQLEATWEMQTPDGGAFEHSPKFFLSRAK